MKRPVPKALRINCPGWHDPSIGQSGRTYSGGDILKGDQIGARLLEAYYGRETYRDRATGRTPFVCEEVYVPEVVPTDQELRSQVSEVTPEVTPKVNAEVNTEVNTEELPKSDPGKEPDPQPERRRPGRPVKN